jgi:hypothetical protein
MKYRLDPRVAHLRRRRSTRILGDGFGGVLEYDGRAGHTYRSQVGGAQHTAPDLMSSLRHQAANHPSATVRKLAGTTKTKESTDD